MNVNVAALLATLASQVPYTGLKPTGVNAAVSVRFTPAGPWVATVPTDAVSVVASTTLACSAVPQVGLLECVPSTMNVE
jgi:hypothetical protein